MTAQTSAPWLRLSRTATDPLSYVTVFAVIGLAAGVSMAVLGLPPVDLHGPLHRFFGIMDPLCGGTRAARYTLIGQWGQAWRYNPLGLLAVAGAIIAVLRAIVGWTTGRWWTVVVGWTPRRRRLAWAVVVVVVLLLEVRQQSIAPLLTAAA